MSARVHDSTQINGQYKMKKFQPGKLSMRMLAGIGIAAQALVGSQALAQQQAAAPATNIANATSTAWVKICNTDPATQKNVCLTSSSLRSQSGQFLSETAVKEVQGEERKLLILAVPPGMQIQPGLIVQVDGGQRLEAKYSICFPNACYADLVIDDGFVSSLKAGNTLQVTTLNQQAKAVPFAISLSGFTASYDGDAIDPNALVELRQKEQEQFESWSDKVRQQLIEQQRSEGSGN